jgi:hypothetical protein
MKKSFILFIILILAFFIGCSTMQSIWQETKSINSIEAYKNFLKKYPYGVLSDSASSMLNQIYEQNQQRDYIVLESKNTIEDYENFLGKYPQGKFTNQALEKLNQLYEQREEKKTTEELLSDLNNSKEIIKKYAIESLEKKAPEILLQYFQKCLNKKEDYHKICELLKFACSDTYDQILTEYIKSNPTILDDGKINIEDQKCIITGLTNIKDETLIKNTLNHLIRIPPNVSYHSEPTYTFDVSGYNSGSGYSPYSGSTKRITAKESGSRWEYNADELSLKEFIMKSLWKIDPLIVTNLFIKMYTYGEQFTLILEYEKQEEMGIEKYSDVVKNIIFETSKDERSNALPKLLIELKKDSPTLKINTAFVLVLLFNIRSKDPEANIIVSNLTPLLMSDDKRIRDGAKMVLDGLNL